jgi:hypothetical protein
MKRNLISIVILFLFIATLYACGASGPTLTSTPTPDETKEKGFLEGTVRFVGIPCYHGEENGHIPPVPPCDGPYPHYEITVYRTSDETIVATTSSDENGKYTISLNPGNYVIYTQNGLFEDDVAANQVTITSGKTTILDLTIDTGIR